ncbi:MAG: hypothetical protein FJX54_17845 [Alphaproteobacteria bacterium]|nr:hypothetical protein [Alphaproteobacteria bacterium]
MPGDAPISRNAVHVIPSCEFGGQVGVACGDITPPDGIYFRLWGSAKHDQPSGVHRPMLATCAVFADNAGNNEMALISIDLSWWRSKEDEEGVRLAVLKAAGLDEDRLIIQPTHSHSAPMVDPDLADKPGGHLVAGHRARLIETCIRLVDEARGKLRPATLTWTTGRCQLAFNRNFPSPEDGTSLCGLNPYAQADDTLLIGRVADAEGRVLLTLANYACHPISLGGGNTQVSPDYIGALRETVEKETGGAPLLFLHGASGDMAPRRAYESDPRIADKNGRELGFATLAGLTSMLQPGMAMVFAGAEQSATPLAIWRERPAPVNPRMGAKRVTVRLEVADMPTRADLEKQVAASTDRAATERLNRALLRRRAVGDEREMDVSFLIWQLGDAFVMAMPGEMHTDFQIRLRARFPKAKIAVLNIANGSLGYLPPAEEFPMRTYQTAIALHKPGSDDRVLEAAARAINEMIAA